MKSASADPLWAAIHRRAGRLNIACNVANDGRSAEFFRIEKIRGDFYRFDLGRIEGSDPYFTVLAGYREHTPLDAELLSQHHAYIERQAQEIDVACLAITSKLGQAVDAFVS